VDRDRRRLTFSPVVRARLAFAAALLVPGAFLAVFFVYPMVAILGRGFAPEGALDLSVVGDAAGSTRFRAVAWFTVWQASASTAITLALGLPVAWALHRFEFPGRRVLRAVVTVPFVLPSVAVGTAFLALLGPNGVLGDWGLAPGIGAILLAHVFFNLAVVVRTVGGFWAHLDPRREEAARVLGASPAAAFTRVTLPLLAPAIASAASIVFLFTFTSFGAVLLLGTPAQRTLEVEIYRQTAVFLDLPVAAVLATVQLLAVAATVVVSNRLQRRRAHAQSLVSEAVAARPPRTRSERALLGAALVILVALLAAPIGALVWRSLTVGGSLSLDAYRGLGARARTTGAFVPPIEAVRNSLVFAVIAAAIAVTVGGLASMAVRRAWRGSAALDALVMLPIGASAVTIGFGFLVALDEPPLDLRSEPILVPIAQALVAVPFVVRLVVPALRAVDERLRDAAAVLGASPGRVWREVDLPIVGRALLVATAFAFAISLGEFGATVFIARPDYPTVPVAIFRALGRPGTASLQQALALSVVLVALTAVVVVAVDRLRVRDVGEF
jgi:thiamine transport system permease protein